MQDHGSSRSGVVAGKGLHPGSQMAPPCSFLTWWNGQESSVGLFYKGINLIHLVSTLRTLSPLKGQHLEGENFNTNILGEHIQTIVVMFCQETR